MLLSKRIAVYLNLTGCKLKQYTTSVLKKNGIDLTPEQFLLIDLLWNQGVMSQQEIADTMQKDKNSVTKLVDALEKKNLVTRQQDPNDRRSNKLLLTDEANALKKKAKQVGIITIDGVLEGISQEEQEIFLKVLHKMSDNMERV